MRILYTLSDQIKARQLSGFLASEGIENQLEVQTVTDWGSAHYGDLQCSIWVSDEDQVPLAKRWIQKFEEDPNHIIFKKFLPHFDMPFKKQSQERRVEEAVKKPSTCTFALLILCSLLFIIIESSAPPIPKYYPEYLPATALFSPPVKKALFYDYPKKYELADQLVSLFGFEKLEQPQDLPVQGQNLLKQFFNTPFWQGVYPKLLAWAKQREIMKGDETAPMFEKIQQGEIWRVFTPCLMHNDILHLLFNMLWLIFLGKQLEERLGGFKYLALIFLTGVFSNTCQYLMSGANFIGISGALCGMLTFIWIRQKRAPWEGYPLQKATIAFLMLFVFAMLSIQLVSFYLEATGETYASTGIANTAHLSGAMLGAILGYFPFFSWKT